MTKKHRVVIVGGGASAICVCLELLRETTERFIIEIIEKNPRQVARGIAYQPASVEYLLNAPAGRMSARIDIPDDFLNWVRSTGQSAQPSDFLPRDLYGQYLEAQLAALREQYPHLLSITHGEVLEIIPSDGSSAQLLLADGSSRDADYVVLAIGNYPSQSLAETLLAPVKTQLKNAWDVNADDLRPYRHVVLIGSGLTALDICWDIAKKQYPVAVTMVSRRGLMPMPHDALLPESSIAPAEFFGEHGELKLELLQRECATTALRGMTTPLSFRALLRLLRAAYAQYGNGRMLVRGLRSLTPDLWAGFSLEEKRRFLRHFFTLWNVIRHPVPNQVHDATARLLESRQFRIIAGRIQSAVPRADALKEGGVTLVIRKRISGQMISLDADCIVDCSGFSSSFSSLRGAPLRSLIDQGIVRPDPLNFGMDTTREGNAIDRSGAVVPWLFAIGTIRTGVELEVTAVRELRLQAHHIRTRLYAACADASQASRSA